MVRETPNTHPPPLTPPTPSPPAGRGSPSGLVGRRHGSCWAGGFVGPGEWRRARAGVVVQIDNRRRGWLFSVDGDMRYIGRSRPAASHGTPSGVFPIRNPMARRYFHGALTRSGRPVAAWAPRIDGFHCPSAIEGYRRQRLVPGLKDLVGAERGSRCVRLVR